MILSKSFYVSLDLCNIFMFLNKYNFQFKGQMEFPEKVIRVIFTKGCTSKFVSNHLEVFLEKSVL